MITRDIALIILAGVVVATVGASVTALAIAGNLPVTTAGLILTALVAVATSALGRLTGVGTSTVTNNVAAEEN